MGQDTPDWGGKYVNGQFYPLEDLGELAARLGSVVTYDRRGAVIWWYDFRYGIGDVGPSTSGTGSSVALSPHIYESPPFSCILYSGTTYDAAAWVGRRVARPVSPRVGFQASVRLDVNVSLVWHQIIHYDGVSRWSSYLLIDQDANTLQVYTAESGLVTLLSGLTDLSSGYYFSHLKLVVDLSDHSLVRAVLDNHEFDLTAYTMAATPDASAENVRCRVINQGHNLVVAPVNVDNLIITANEP
jgi:hypothetical protein